MTNETDLPFGDISSTFKGMGTAPALESLELGDDVPVAINPDDISREATRYVFFAGNVITPQQKRERPDLRLGGEYFGQEYKTLIRSKGLLRRCQVTPLEIGFDFMGEEQIGDNATGLQVVSQIQHSTPGSVLAPSKLNAVQMYPGDEIKGILRGNSNGTNKGFVELKQLAGIDYPDFRQSGIQEFIFPEWQKILAGATDLPIKLAELVAHLHSRRTETADLDLKGIIETMLVSCDQYREWGMKYLKFSSMLVKVPAHQGFVHTYSDLAEMLFVELDVRREDAMLTDGFEDILAKAQAGNSISNDETQALLKMMAQNQELLTQMLLGKQPKVETVPVIFDGDEAAPITYDIELDPARCSVITGNGTQCGNEADETGRCKHPAHKL